MRWGSNVLYRSEVIAYQNRDRLPGEVLIQTPFSFYLVSGFFIFCLLLGFFLAIRAEYPRIESVRGMILPDRGLIAVTPSRAGRVISIHTRDGQAVESGQLLASIQVDESTKDGAYSADVLTAAAGAQKQSITSQIEAVEGSGRAKGQQLNAQAEGLVREIAQLQEQLTLQADLISSAQTELENARTMAKNGFASKAYLQTSMDTLTQRRLSASSVRQSIYTKQTELRAISTTIKQAESETAAQVASLLAAKAQIDQQVVGIELSGSYQIRAPVAGTIAHVSFKIGQPVSPLIPLITMVPTGSILRAEFNVPTSSIGFIGVGQRVRLALDSFPYQKFGTMEGTITNISSSAVSTTGGQGEINLAYPVIVGLRTQAFNVGSNRIPLLPGMTLGARIVTDRRTFFEWIFEPFYSVWKRD